MKYDGIETDPRVKHHFKTVAHYGLLLTPTRAMKRQRGIPMSERLDSWRRANARWIWERAWKWDRP